MNETASGFVNHNRIENYVKVYHARNLEKEGEGGKRKK
jgi:hypothetical protein